MKYFELYNFFNSIVQIPQNQWIEVEAMFEEKTYKKGGHIIKESQI